MNSGSKTFDEGRQNIFRCVSGREVGSTCFVTSCTCTRVCLLRLYLSNNCSCFQSEEMVIIEEQLEKKKSKSGMKQGVGQITHTNYIYVLFPYTSGIHCYSRVYSLDTVVLNNELNREGRYCTCLYTFRQDFSSIDIYYLLIIVRSYHRPLSVLVFLSLKASVHVEPRCGACIDT